jgi:hypothetical protein
MSAPRSMPPLRRRAIPGMTAPTPPATAPAETHEEPATPPAALVGTPPPDEPPRTVQSAPGRAVSEAQLRRPSDDYGATRLVNFRLPVDLHDRYRRLVRDVEDAHPRLRRPSLTDVIIGLLEEGPGDVDELAALIRRKRASETREDGLR